MTLIKTTYDRRSFIKVSSLSTGGMLLGFSWLASCKPEQVANLPKEWFDINGFLKIADNGLVTIMSPNPEIGQNVKTSMPMIVAEELDVNWESVVVEQAGLDTSIFTRQLAGGSQSIRQGWESLRMAGATARRMLMEAAAQQWNVPVSELSTTDGVIKHGDKELGYGEVASAASQMKVPEEVELKDPKDFKIIGTPTKNVDGKKIVTGEPLFGLDTKKEGMLIAMIEHPPAFGMTLKSFDATEAKAMPGIKSVFTFTTIPEGKEKQRFDTNNAFNDLVAIVGNSTWQVMKAKKALKVEWEQVSPLESTSDYVKSLDDLVKSKADEPGRKDGNPDRAFRRAAKVIERSYSAPFLAHNTLEPMNFFADVKEDKAELIGPIQTPEFMSKTASQVLEMPEEKIAFQVRET